MSVTKHYGTGDGRTRANRNFYSTLKLNKMLIYIVEMINIKQIHI